MDLQLYLEFKLKYLDFFKMLNAIDTFILEFKP